MSSDCDPDDLVLDVLQGGVQNYALVLNDDNGNSVAEFTNSSESSLDATTVNIENSSDIIIGHVTQLNGPITIYPNGLVPPEEKTKTCQNENLGCTSEGPYTRVRKFFKSLSFYKRLLYIGIPLIILVIALVATITLVALNSTKSGLNRSEKDDEEIPEDGDVYKPLGPRAIIQKHVWCGRENLNGTIPLHHPTHLVVISHTGNRFCSHFGLCKETVRLFQDQHVAEKYPDIKYNFLIGGDGNAYVGRGWDVTSYHRNESIGISFIGNFSIDVLTVDMIEVTKMILEDGVDKGKLATDYILVAHNQIEDTLSPGPHVYEVIKTWPNFSPNYLQSFA